MLSFNRLINQHACTLCVIWWYSLLDNVRSHIDTIIRAIFPGHILARISKLLWFKVPRECFENIRNRCHTPIGQHTQTKPNPRYFWQYSNPDQVREKWHIWSPYYNNTYHIISEDFLLLRFNTPLRISMKCHFKYIYENHIKPISEKYIKSILKEYFPIFLFKKYTNSTLE